MSERFLMVEERAEAGTGSARALRREGRLPAVVYGFGENKKVSFLYKDFYKEYEKGGILSKLMSIKLGKDTINVLPRDVQIHPVTDRPLHVDMQFVKSDVPVKISVKVVVKNKDKSPGVKKGGVLNIVKKFIHLSCLPKSIPQKIEIDVAGFEIGKSVHLTDIELPKGVESIEKDNFTILAITGRGKEEESEKAEEQAAETK